MGVLDGKVAIVTGSARGIGRATAELLSEQGASVLINDLDGDVAEQTASEIAGETAVYAGDLTKEGAADELVQTAIDGQAYVRVSDVAKALGMTVVARADGFELRKAGGANQVEGTVTGKVGDTLFDGNWRFQVLKVEKLGLLRDDQQDDARLRRLQRHRGVRQRQAGVQAEAGPGAGGGLLPGDEREETVAGPLDPQQRHAHGPGRYAGQVPSAHRLRHGGVGAVPRARPCFPARGRSSRSSSACRKGRSSRTWSSPSARSATRGTTCGSRWGSEGVTRGYTCRCCGEFQLSQFPFGRPDRADPGRRRAAGRTSTFCLLVPVPSASRVRAGRVGRPRAGANERRRRAAL